MLNYFKRQSALSTLTLGLFAALFLPVVLHAQQIQTITKKGYTLHFLAQNPDFDIAQQKRLQEVFFTNYPKLVKDYNKNSFKEVYITIDTAYDGVAYAHNGKIVIAQAWMEKMPEDIDVVTHEVMHIVQAYPPRSGPGWLVEGVADYVRYKYGVNNKAANWSLPALKEDHRYTSSYRIAARFLDWVETDKKKGAVKLLDAAMRNKTYTPEIWVSLTGMELDALWDAYVAANKV
ncbi:basic secretory family protein [Sphingobacterium sp. lm-10]|uniref:basic secretory family protein n=1 Tax=Sphingobacterium sp. lm-10 TaxID=2944904 RepID=UPI0020221669|nr:basic secretory family protein [Sphingobacterium sp. lm-10]MCL7988117.1 basic secretory family protein [Sphingobacterium sp. lm-10]